MNKGKSSKAGNSKVSGVPGVSEKGRWTGELGHIGLGSQKFGFHLEYNGERVLFPHKIFKLR